MEMLPDIWINQTGVQLHSLTTFISQDSEFVDWKKFLILASSPLPMPSRDELFNTLSRFMNIDVEKTGLVSEQQFLQVYSSYNPEFEIQSNKSSLLIQFK
jgi:Ca2+-binding EF-hand superfamily protein